MKSTQVSTALQSMISSFRLCQKVFTYEGKGRFIYNLVPGYLLVLLFHLTLINRKRQVTLNLACPPSHLTSVPEPTRSRLFISVLQCSGNCSRTFVGFQNPCLMSSEVFRSYNMVARGV